MSSGQSSRAQGESAKTRFNRAGRDVSRSASDAAAAARLSTGARVALFCIVGGVGAYICALYFGLAPWRPPRHCSAVFCDPYHWQVLCFGLSFFLAGLAFLIPREWSWLGRTCSTGIVVALIAGLVGTFAVR